MVTLFWVSILYACTLYLAEKSCIESFLCEVREISFILGPLIHSLIVLTSKISSILDLIFLHLYSFEEVSDYSASPFWANSQKIFSLNLP